MSKPLLRFDSSAPSASSVHEAKPLVRRRRLVLMAVCALAADLAWPIDKPKRIGILAFGARRPQSLERFIARMAELGWREGPDYVFEWRVTAGKPERLADAAAELVLSRVDVFLCPSTAMTLAARRATATIPIVINGVSDPVASGLVKSLARPDGNITGFVSVGEHLNEKRLGLMRELLPAIRTLAVIWSAEDATHSREMQQIEAVAPQLGLEVRRVELSRVEDRDHSGQRRSASDPASWTLIIEVPLHRAARGGWRGTVRKQPRSPIRAVLIAVIATAAVLGALLLILWIDATSTGTVPL